MSKITSYGHTTLDYKICTCITKLSNQRTVFLAVCKVRAQNSYSEDL